jgi:protein-S-isoprenylcysteine O-methyltransferase Ste14
VTVWCAWLFTWLVFSLRVKDTVRRQATLPRLLNTGLLVCVFGLLWAQQLPAPALMERFLPASQWQFWVPLGAALTLVGLLFTVWARIYLGRNWSGVASIKADHELVTGGPYALVRHPIYSGLALAFIGSALAIGQWRGVLAVALGFIAFTHRIVVEESFMRQQFGAAYEQYAQRIRALVPGVI